MSKKLPKYLVETSALEPALLEATPAHKTHFEDAVRGGELWSSVYIRKEFMRRWFCDCVEMA